MSGFDRSTHNRKIARLGGLACAASRDGREATQRARDRFQASFEAQVRMRFPDLTDEAEIRRRADLVRRLHYARLGYLSSVARAKKAGKR